MSEETKVEESVVRTRKTYKVDPASFVTAWQEANTVQEVADKLGIPKDVVLSRANAYRKKGVALKEIARVKKASTPRTPRPKLDVDALNAIVQTTVVATPQE